MDNMITKQGARKTISTPVNEMVFPACSSESSSQLACLVGSEDGFP